MSTTIYSLNNTTTSSGTLGHTDVNAISNTIELIGTQLSKLAGSGCLLTTDFNGTAVSSALSITISAGTAIVGTAGSQIIIKQTGNVTVTGLVGGVTNYIYLKTDGTYTSNTTGTIPTGSILVCTCITSSTQVTSVNQFPYRRINLLSISTVFASTTDNQGDYLNNKINGVAGFSTKLLNNSKSQNIYLGAASSGHTDGGGNNLPTISEHDHYVAITADTHYYGPPCLIFLPDSRLLCLYRKGTTNGADNGVAAAKWSSDFGQTWSAETIFTAFSSFPPGAANPDVQDFQAVLVPAGTSLPNGSTILVDTLVGVFFAFDRSNGNFVYCYSTNSTDYGATWTTPTQLPLGPTYVWVALGAPPILLPDGSILMPQYGEATQVHVPQQEAIFYSKSTDGGVTWGNPITIAAYSGTRMGEPNLLYINDGTTNGKILCLIRNLSETPVQNGGHIMSCSSTDLGATWTSPANIFHGSSSPICALSSDKTVVVVYRNTSIPNTSGGANLEGVIRTSSDYGVTWLSDNQQVFLDSDRTKFFLGGYASLTELLPGVMAIAYTATSSTSGSTTVACDLRFKYLFQKEAGAFSPIGSSAFLSMAVSGRLSVQGNSASVIVRDDYSNLSSRPPAPVACAALQIDSTTRGILLPRMTTTQRNAISGAIAGLCIHNTTTTHLEYYDGTGWKTLADLTGIYVSSFNTRQGAVTLLSSDVTTALGYTPLNKAGDTMTGNLVLSSDPTVPLGAVTERYSNRGRGLSTWYDSSATTAALNMPAGPNSRHWVDTVNDSNYNEEPTITLLADGRLFAAYRKGTSRNSDRGVIYYRTSIGSSLGATWGTETILVAQDATYDWQYPCVTQTSDGTIYITYYDLKPGDGSYINRGWLIKSTNNGVSWSAPIQIPPTGAGATLTSYVLPVGPLVQMGNGNLGLVYYTTLNGGVDVKDSTVFVSSSNGGTSWTAPTIIANGQTDTRNYDTPYLLGCANGDLLCFLNDSTSHLIRVYKSTSPSYGASWTAGGTFNGQGNPDACQLADGTIVCVYRERTANSGYGTAQVIRISSDEGATWTADTNEKAVDVTASSLSFFEADLFPIAPGLIAIIYSIENSSSDSDIRFRYISQGGNIDPSGGGTFRSAYIEEGELVVHGGHIRTTQFGVVESKASTSACLQSDDTSHGWLAPRQTSTQESAISSPAQGLFVFNTTTNRFEYYNGTQWLALNPRGNVTLTDATTIATDSSKGDYFTVTLGASRTLGAPTNPVDGQTITYAITQGGSGSNTLAYNAAFSFGTTIPQPTLSTTIGKIDYLTFRYNATANKWHCIIADLGY